MEIRALAAKETANGSSNATNVSRATSVYCLATAASTVTLSEGGTFQMGVNQALIIHKEAAETVYASSANVHFTKIAYPRG